jgi:hypothetical protein
LLRRLHALRAMAERLCVQVYVEAVPEMTELFPTPHHVATTATELWVEALINEFSKCEVRRARRCSAKSSGRAL